MAHVGSFASDSAVYLGQARPFRAPRWARERSLWLLTADRLMHLYITGRSGSGKTEGGKKIFAADLAANRSVTWIDPDSDGCAQILGYVAELSLPGPLTARAVAGLGDKLVLLDFGRGDQVPGVNLLTVRPGQDAFGVIDGIVATMRDLWADAWGDRMADILRQSLSGLQSLGLTFAELLPFITDHEVRDLLVSRCPLPEVRMFFQQHLGTLRPHEQRVWLESTRNKVAAFLAAPSIRAFLGQLRSTIDFRDILDGKWMLVNLSKDRLKEARRLLGGLLVNGLHNGAISRQDTPPEQRIWHQIFIDEFQQLYCTAMDSFWTGSRKLGVGLCAIHQGLTQRPFDREPAAIDTVITNSATQIVFGTSRQDAERLAGELFAASGTEIKMQRRLLGIPLERPTFWTMHEEREGHQQELMQQRTGEAYVKLRGQAEPYALRVPYVPDPVVDPEKIEALREHCNQRYCRSVAEVNREITERWARLRAEANAMPRRRHDFNR